MALPALLTLSAGPLELELSPSIGGCITRFDQDFGDRRAAVLRKCHSPVENVLDAASFPLVPYVNRIRGGGFSFRGRIVRIAPNMPGDVSPLHGDGWLGTWAVDSAGADAAVLSFEHEAGEWPWRYVARQDFALDADGLSLRLSCANRSDTPMPCGLGFHPYFDCGPDTVLDTRVADVWTIDENVLPVDKVPATGRFDLRGRTVCGQGLDHGFGGWGGSAKMTDPGWPFEIELSSSDAHFFQLYSPADGGIFVAEPVSHANAALNAPEAQWPGLGMRVLEPGDEMSLAMRIDVGPARQAG